MTSIKQRLATTSEAATRRSDPLLRTPVPADDIAEINKAAQLLLRQIPEHAAELIHKLAEQHKIDLWKYTCGLILSLHMEGRLSDITIDPAWKDGLRKTHLVCKHCNQAFAPRHLGQLYCCNECGLRAMGMWHGLNPDLKGVKSVDLPTVDVGSSADSGWADSTPAVAAAA